MGAARERRDPHLPAQSEPRGVGRRARGSSLQQTPRTPRTGTRALVSGRRAGGPSVGRSCLPRQSTPTDFALGFYTTHNTMVQATTASQCPVAPKRGWMLVADHSPGEEIRDSGLIIPRGAVEHVRRARVVKLGKNPFDFRTGIEHPWDYAEGDLIVLSDQATNAWLPMDWQGQKVALINEFHIIGLWLGE